MGSSPMTLTLRQRLAAVGLTVLCASHGVSGTGSAQASGGSPEPFQLATAAGDRPALLYSVTVPERRGADSPAKQVELAVVRWPARGEPTRAPVMYLAGGPGGSAISSVRLPELTAMLDRVREHADVLLMDQRGTGRSTPRLVCPPAGPLPDDVFASLDAMRRALEPRVRACLAHWGERGVDPGAYTTEATADDIAEVVKRLGYEQVSLLGFSYGTHLSLATMRRHPALVDRVVLAGIEGPDDTQKLPSVFDVQFAKLAALAAADPDIHGAMPDLQATLASVLDRAAREPFVVAAGARTLRIGKAGLQYLLRRDIGDTNDLPVFPRFIWQLSQGDTRILAQVAARRYRQLSAMALMPLAMDCASGMSEGRRRAIASELEGSRFGAMTNFPFPDVCDTLGLTPLPDAFRAPVVSSIPALLVSGTLDAQTPPYQAERVRWGLLNAAHLIVEHAGHESTLTHPAIQDAVVAFLRGDGVESRTVAASALAFRPLR